MGIRLAQALHHGTDHRSQICTALTTLGVEPPEIDVWAFAAKRAGSSSFRHRRRRRWRRLRAVEREADGVQHCGLSRTGRADQGEEVGVGEVDCGVVPEDREPGHVQAHRTHRVLDLLEELVEEFLHALVGVAPAVQVVGEQLQRRTPRALRDAGTAARRGQQLRVDADLQRPGLCS